MNGIKPSAARLILGLVLGAMMLAATVTSASAIVLVTVTGTVVDETGAPHAGGGVSASGGFGEVDALGHFSFTAAESASTPVDVRWGGREEADLTVTTNNISISGATNLGQLRTPPTRTLNIHLVDGSGASVAGAYIGEFFGSPNRTLQWQDTGFEMAPGVQAVSARQYFSAQQTGADGTVEFEVFRGTHSPIFVRYRYPDTSIEDGLIIPAFTISADKEITAVLGTVPDAPSAVVAKAGDRSAIVSWSQPATAPAAQVTGYVVTATPGGLTKSIPLVFQNPPTSASFTGLTNGVAYTFTVRATSLNGDTPESAPSNSVTPAPPGRAPSRVAIPIASAKANGKVVVAWRPAAANGSPITNYAAYYKTPSGKTPYVRVGGRHTRAVFKGLNPGVYKFRVIAFNALGSSPPSGAVRVLVK